MKQYPLNNLEANQHLNLNDPLWVEFLTMEQEYVDRLEELIDRLQDGKRTLLIFELRRRQRFIDALSE